MSTTTSLFRWGAGLLFILAYAYNSQLSAQTQPSCMADENLKLVICPQPITTETIDSLVVLSNDEVFTLTTSPLTGPAVNEVYPATAPDGQVYSVYFTQRPVINISASSPLNNNTKVTSNLTYLHETERIEANVGIEFRGATALSYPKKSYDLEFWTDIDNESQDVTLAGMRSDDDWVLDALYNEPLRINALVAQQLWNDLYELPYAEEDDRARGGAAVEFVEVFFNGSYRGIYTLGEQVDRKLLRLKKTDGDTVRGHLVKVWARPERQSSTLTGPPRSTDEVWSGYELKYPNPNDTIVWDPLLQLHDRFAPTANLVDAPIFGTLLDLENTIDYELYVNVIGGIDNELKNIYFARRDSASPYLYIPWDLDASFGNSWDGTRVTWGDAIFVPLFYDVIHNQADSAYFEARCARYSELKRSGLFTDEYINDELEANYQQLTDELFYEREGLVWSRTLAANQDELNYTQDWVTRRFEVLDTLYCPDGLLSTSTVAAKRVTEFKISPNPTQDQLIIADPAIELASQQARIYNMEGKLLLSFQFPPRPLPGNVTVDVSSLQAGVYVLSVGGISKLFVKQ